MRRSVSTAKCTQQQLSKSESFRVTVGVLKSKLRSNIPAMSNALKLRIREVVALEVAPANGMCE